MQRKPGRAPSGRLSRLKPVEQDPLAVYGLISKGDKRLLAHKVQESYYTLIVSRYLAFCTEAGDRETLQKQFARLSLSTGATTSTSPLPPPTTSPSPSHPEDSQAHAQAQPRSKPTTTPSSSSTASNKTSQSQTSNSQTQQEKQREKQNETLDTILAAIRKLREALHASRRHDDFATQVYLFAARVGILAGAYETYYPALSHLLWWYEVRRGRGRRAQQVGGVASGGGAGQGQGEGQGGGGRGTATQGLGSGGKGSGSGTGSGSGAGNASSTTTPNSSNTADLTTTELHEVLSYLILDAACRRDNLAEAYALRSRYALADAQVNLVLRALVRDNWVVWRRAKGQVDGYRAKLMEAAEQRMRKHTLKAFGRAYYSVPLGVLEEQTGCGWAELTGGFGVGWELEGERVIIRKVPGRG